MVRQGKSSESLTKSALKKAKRAAAKAQQDLARVFDTKIDKEANTPDLDAVDVSPVQIPRKTDVASVSSLAPPVQMSQNIQARSLTPPEGL